jgi:hypothetical protein
MQNKKQLKGVLVMKNTEWQDGMAPQMGRTGMAPQMGRTGMAPQMGGAGMAPQMGGAGMGNGTEAVPDERSKTRVMGGELVMMLNEGVRSGDVDRGYPEEIGRLVQMGATLAELAETLKQGAQRGRISPLMLARVEKMLGLGPADDELVDRNQVLSRNRNKLAQ